MLGNPQVGRARAENILNCLQSLIPLLNDDLTELWDAVIPKLLSYLDGKNLKVGDILLIYCL